MDLGGGLRAMVACQHPLDTPAFAGPIMIEPGLLRFVTAGIKIGQ
jgi:hypothetical protein